MFAGGEVYFKGSIEEEGLVTVVAKGSFVSQVGSGSQSIEGDFYSGIGIGSGPIEDFCYGQTDFWRHPNNILQREYFIQSSNPKSLSI